MNETIQIAIAVQDETIREQLIAQLAAAGFDAFEEKEEELLCFIDGKNYDTSRFENIVSAFNLTYTTTKIEEQNWNALWESNFSPVVIDDFCAVRAHFHPPFVDKKHEILITPKMSFGTGHHATTYMMISEMSKLDFKNKRVADFGTGTGVLAILAEKLGSTYILAIDNDDWSIENATENFEKNGCKYVKIEKADQFDTNETFDIVLANINKNVILSNVEYMLKRLNGSAQLLLSGLLKEDEDDIVSVFSLKGCKHLSTVERNNWICLLFQYELNCN